MGSVSQIGWQWYSRLARRLPVTLVTHSRNRQALEKAGAPLPGSEVIFIDTEWFAGPLYRLASRLFPRSEHPVFLISSLDFFVYDRVARRRLSRRLQAGAPWRIVHQPTPVSPLAATSLHRLGLPLILGPWNGGLRSPDTFPEIMQAESGWLYPIRRLGQLIDRLQGTTRRARMILTATRSTRAAIPERWRGKCVDMLENGVNLDTFQALPWPPAPSATTPLKILFVGRLLPFKGVAMLLDALTRMPPGQPTHLDIVGNGPEAQSLRDQAERLGLAERVVFHGELPHTAIAELMRDTHVFCLPSVRESGGAVLLEAMAAARPVIALDYGGPAEIVDDHVGALIPATGRDSVVADLAHTLGHVMAEPAAWRDRGLAGRRRVEERFSWPAKIEAALALYETCLVQP
ncbi:MAG: glycosyltransferase family 4 protein [Methylococcus sp.]